MLIGNAFIKLPAPKNISTKDTQFFFSKHLTHCHPDKQCCGKLLLSDLHKDLHDAKKHCLKTSEGKSKCAKCDFVGQGIKTIVNHIKKDHYKVISEQTCETCGQRFANASNLKWHQKTVHVDSQFSCKHCGKNFKLQVYLKNHLWIVHSEGDGPIYTCEQCGKTYKVFECLKHHKIRHHGHKGHFVCEHCGNSFNNELSLKQHVKRYHVKARVPTKCDICHKEFPDEELMKHHRKLVHFKKGLPLRDKKCQFCPDMFTNNKTRKEHERNIHLGIKDFACDQCDYKCGRKATLKSHIDTIHSGEMFDCDVPGCSKSYNAKGNLDAHRFRVHKIPRPKQLQKQ